MKHGGECKNVLSSKLFWAEGCDKMREWDILFVWVVKYNQLQHQFCWLHSVRLLEFVNYMTYAYYYLYVFLYLLILLSLLVAMLFLITGDCVSLVAWQYENTTFLFVMNYAISNTILLATAIILIIWSYFFILTTCLPSYRR